MQFSPECALFSLGLPAATEVSAAERSGVAVTGVVAEDRQETRAHDNMRRVHERAQKTESEDFGEHGAPARTPVTPIDHSRTGGPDPHFWRNDEEWQ